MILLGNNENDPKAKIDIECDDRLQRRTALHAAAASRHHKILTILAGKDGRGLNWKDSDQKTALELATANGCELSIIALVKAFANRGNWASEATAPSKYRKPRSSRLKKPEQGWSKHRQSIVKRDELAVAPRSPETIEAAEGSLADEPTSEFFPQEDNKVIEICHWREAVDLSILSGHRKALVKMIELADGTSRNETWAQALSTAAEAGKEEILAMLLDHKEPSKNECRKVRDKRKAAKGHQKGLDVSLKATTKNDPMGQQSLKTKNPIAAGGPRSSEGEQLQPKIASLVQRKNMDMLINRKDNNNRTPLFWAANNGYAKADATLRKRSQHRSHK